ncbi:uncharacterized protein LOC126899520 [Daktulosphaira vitifoliae]|uniref:uncharacterized protein LOC126899520 n=1 Tax=Daktulosphaira vitifoliae TaxID=58002 RepID=UPI0021A9C8C0|nr:uncharacterized protein LOC126899520 [Daktulosphaira vitifoliae]
MEISKHFISILKSIEYHIGHLPKDVLAHEGQLPELRPIFTWFLNNISPKNNCVTPKDIALFTSLSSKYDISSLDKVSSAINKYYDKSTKDTPITPVDLETLEEMIFKSDLELNYLKDQNDIYKKKKENINFEIVELEKEEKKSFKSYVTMINDIESVMNNFTEGLDNFSNNILKLQNHTKNILYDDDCLTKLAAKKLTEIADSWRLQILKMIDLWFEDKDSSPEEIDFYLKNISQLSLVTKSIECLKNAEYLIKCYCLNLNTTIQNLFNVINMIKENKENLDLNNLNITSFLHILSKSQTLPQITINEINPMSDVSHIVLADTKNKMNQLDTMLKQITFIEESIEHYIIMCDVLWCLMRTDCSLANVKCELILRCAELLDKLLSDIVKSEDMTLQINKLMKENSNKSNQEIFINKEINFNGYTQYLNKYSENAEFTHLLQFVQKWKSKYHYTRDECNKLINLQNSINKCNEMINGLMLN